MKSKLIILVLGMLVSVAAFSNDEENGEPTPEAAAEQSYVFQCSPVEDVVKLVGKEMKDVTAEDMKELIDMRKTTFEIIKGGKPALKDLLDKGDKSDIGGFGVILACGVVEQIAEKVKARGCLNIETKEVINDGPGIAACQEILEKVKNK